MSLSKILPWPRTAETRSGLWSLIQTWIGLSLSSDNIYCIHPSALILSPSLFPLSRCCTHPVWLFARASPVQSTEDDATSRDDWIQYDRYPDEQKKQSGDRLWKMWHFRYSNAKLRKLETTADFVKMSYVEKKKKAKNDSGRRPFKCEKQQFKIKEHWNLWWMTD